MKQIRSCEVFRTHILNLWFDFTKQIDKLDVGGEKQLSRWSTAQMEFGMKKMELCGWAEIKH